jgi:integrase
MMKLTSAFAPHLQGLMNLKRSSGFDLGYMKRHLEEFDRYCLMHFPETTELTRELAEGWASDTASISVQERNRRIRTMRHLGYYLRSLGIDAFVCQGRIKIPRPRQPHLFTDAQLAEFFSVCDTVPEICASPLRHLVLPVMFRVIYCCGLRNSEAGNIRCVDIDLTAGIVKILGSKMRKDRLVYLADDVTTLCTTYDLRMQAASPKREFFFPNGKGRHFTNTSVCRVFDNIVARTSFADKTSRKPTCHALRHLFAVNSMRRCLAEGRDFNSAVYYLSRYMGHKSPQETLYYLHAIPALAEIVRKMGSGLNDVIGGVRHVCDQ